MDLNALAKTWLALDGDGLAEIATQGRPVPPSALKPMIYLGLSLGLPSWVDRLAWKTFAKVIDRDREHCGARGWNMRLEQNGLGGPHAPQLARGERRCFGHFAVKQVGDSLPGWPEETTLLDYGLGGNGRLDPVTALRDPLVGVGSAEQGLLLGRSYLDLGWSMVSTPSWFLLCPWQALDHQAQPPRTPPQWTGVRTSTP